VPLKKLRDRDVVIGAVEVWGAGLLILTLALGPMALRLVTPVSTPLSLACANATALLPGSQSDIAAATFCLSMRATEATERQALFGIIGSIIVGLTLAVTAVAAVYAAAQVAVGRRAIFLEHRPWVLPRVVTITSDLTFTPDARLSFRFSLENVGRTPARGVHVEAKLHIDWRVPAGEAQRKFAEEITGRALDWGNGQTLVLGMTIFPGELRGFDIGLMVSEADMQAFFDSMDAAFPPPHHDTFTLAVVGAVTYGTLLDEAIHKTGFAFDIRRAQFVNPQGQPSVAMGPGLGNVAQEDLSLQLPWSDVVTD
jgi:hypothetical protein